MKIEMLVGPSKVGDSNIVSPRLGNQGELIVGELNGKYYEQTLRGNAFVYSTAAAGVTLAAAATTSAPMIWNPTGSGKNLEINKITIGYVSATTVAGHLAYAVLNNAGSQVGTAAPIVSLTQVAGVNLLVNAGVSSVMRFAPATVSLTTAPTYLCPMGVSNTAQTAAATNTPWTMTDDVDGRIVIPPGNAFFVVANAAVAMVASIAIWGLEIPIPLTA